MSGRYCHICIEQINLRPMTNINKKLDFSGSTMYVGIDVHLKSWNVSLYCNELFIKNFTQPPEPVHLRTFLTKNYPGATYKCAYESGFCGNWIQRDLTENGMDCIVVNAADVPTTDKSEKNKTDKNDSQRIAKSLQSGFLHAIYIPDRELEADRQLVRCVERFNRDLTRIKNRIKGLLYQMGIKIPERFANSKWSKKFINWLQELECSDPSIKLTLTHQLQMAELYRKQKLILLRDVRSMLHKDRYRDNLRYLQSVPGVGPLTAACLLTEVGDISRFTYFEKLNCFVGFYPSEFSSGERIQHGTITGRKHNRLRSLLIEASWVAIRVDPAFTKAYNDFKLRLGGKRAIIKIARKLLSRIRYVWINQVIYEVGLVK